MRNILPALFLALSVLSARAQHPLSEGLRHSVYTYVYRIDAQEARALFESEMDLVEEKYLHTLIDSCLSGHDGSARLAPGNYLFISASGSDLLWELKTIGDLRYDLINNGHELALSLHTRGGTLIGDAQVSIGHRVIPYDPVSRTYHTTGHRKHPHVAIRWKGAFYFCKLTDRYAGYYRHRAENGISLRERVALVARWLRRTRMSIKRLFRKRVESHSFMVFSKPRYKPGDTVSGKAFILNGRGRPVDGPLSLRLTERDNELDTVLGMIRPYRPGGYAFSFVLSDSLDLTLDEPYGVSLCTARRKAMAKGDFRYEDYELESLRFAARADKEEVSPGDLLSIYLKATDENELAVPDARLEMTVLATQADQFRKGVMFIKDTLWTHSQLLDPVGETKIVLPDSIFPAASIHYEIRCNLLTSNNESRDQTLTGYWHPDSARIYFNQEGDSLGIDYRVGNKRRAARAIQWGFGERGDTIGAGPVSLPTTLLLNPFAESYKVMVLPDSIAGEQELSAERRLVLFDTERSRDSVSIESVNPRGLNFWYTIFGGQDVVERGYTDRLRYHARSRTRRNYFIAVQYLWAGKFVSENYSIPYRDKLLHLEWQAPSIIYPGQATDFAVSVKDADGRPVEGADVTAYSWTSKFEENQGPSVPYLGKLYPRRKMIPNLRTDGELTTNYRSSLNWERWSREMRLDTMEYYKFLHPASVYVNTEPAGNGLTQVAPFVSMHGVLVPVHQLYIDEEPVFFSQARQLSRYSFAVSPGRHSLRMRTPDKMVRIDSVWVERGKKTFICINGDTLAQGSGDDGIRRGDDGVRRGDDPFRRHVSIYKMSDTLTNYEMNLWNHYMIIVSNEYQQRLASITQAGRVVLLNGDRGYRGPGSDLLAGPFTAEDATLHVKDAFDQDFQPEGGNRFTIAKGLIKEKQVEGFPFAKYLDQIRPSYNFGDLVLTEKEVDSLWQDYLENRSASQELFRNERPDKRQNGMLQIGIGQGWKGGAKRKSGIGWYGDNGFIGGAGWKDGEPFITSILLFRYDQPDFIHIYRGLDRNLGYLEPGPYRLLVLLKGNSYLVRDSVVVRPDGLNYYELDGSGLYAKDSMSLHIAGIVNSQDQRQTAGPGSREMDAVSETFNEKYMDVTNFHDYAFGRVTGPNGLPLSYVAVVVKGTRHGTVTDAQGYFRISVPAHGVLVFSSVGFSSIEKPIRDNNGFDIRLQPQVAHLDEVVVVGYGASKRRDVTGSVIRIDEDNLLEGKVAGVSVQNAYDAAFPTKDEAVPDPAMDPAQFPVGLNVLRRRFRDDAFWQPMLTTDQAGIARWHTVFPDDITNWLTYAVAINGKRQSGIGHGAIKSFRILSANLSSPAFGISGDSIRIMGKLLNYGADTVSIRRTFSVDGVEKMNSELQLANAHLDSVGILVGEGDSVRMKYTMQRLNGYFDGEERSIPVYPAGVKETVGVFVPLEDDTSLVLSFDTAMGPVSLHAESSVIPVLLDEIEHLKNYEYLCNEQLASKLMALLQKQALYRALHQEFKEERNITDLIGKLNKSRNAIGLWGWWSGESPTLWISRHVTEAMVAAKQAGYPTMLNKQALIDYLVFALDEYKGAELVDALRLLQDLDAKVDYKRWIDTIGRRASPRSLYDRLTILDLEQRAGIDIDVDSLLARHKITAMGNWYWGEECERMFDNSVQNTLLVYRLLKGAGGGSRGVSGEEVGNGGSGKYERVLRKIRNYFLEKRRNGHWRNTYESCLILNTIMPDLLRLDPGSHPPMLTVNGGTPVTAFPYRASFAARDTLHIDKKGVLPVYFSAFQQYWNKAPQEVDGEFKVRSQFEKDGGAVNRLRAGEPLLLRVDVTVKGDADYVMIEIPIPAGCSYRDKAQSYWQNEVHREYFSNKVSIFCRSLAAGQYSFTVSLMPRYTGRFHLNPAKAELMYFPVLYGREGMKMVDIH